MKVNSFRVVCGMSEAKRVLRNNMPAHAVERLAYCIAISRLALEEAERLTHLDDGAYAPVFEYIEKFYPESKEES